MGTFVTKDIDIAIEMSPENAGKMSVVIQEFGLGSLGLAKDDFLRKNFVTQLGNEPVRIDIINDVEGMTFDDAWQNRKEIEYDGLVIKFIGLDQLIILKKLAGRMQDLTDIEKLKARNKKK
jgi:predicted nucleotidyltransferase